MKEILDTRSKLDILADGALEKFATDVVALEMGPLLYVTDYFLIGTVNSVPQMKAVIHHLKKISKENNFTLYHIEGEKTLSWVLMDFGDIACHFFMPEERQIYDLEGLWFQAEKINFNDTDK